MQKVFWTAILVLAAITAPNACGDTLTDPNGIIIYPDGSVITSNTYVAATAANGYDGYTAISFAFPGGYGSAANETQLGAGESGQIVFTEPVSNVSIYWEDSYGLYMNFYSYEYGELGSFTEPVCASSSATLCNGVVSFADPGQFEMTWTTSQSGYGAYGYGGVSSLNYTVIPEAPTYILLLAGLGLIGLFQRKRSPGWGIRKSLRSCSIAPRTARPYPA